MISIIIPCIRFEYLEECLNSIKSQTYKDVEIIIINDNPTNLELKEYLNSLSGVTIIENSKNIGLSASRNKGINISNGEFIYFLDDDDYLDNANALEDLVILMSENNSEIALTVNFSNEALDQINNIKFEDFYLQLDRDNALRPVSTKIYNKEYLINNNLYFIEGYTAEEDDFLYRLLICNPNISVYANKIYHYRQDTPNSIMKTLKYQQDKSYINILARNRVENSKLKDETKVKALVNINNSTRNGIGVMAGMF